jgi:tetratricopeptide (TPR) repeat protein
VVAVSLKKRKPDQNFSATDAIWRGVYHLNRVTREDNEKARRLFERAIELDPGIAPAHALLGNTYAIEFLNGWSSDPALLDRAEELGRRAVELDASAMDGHLTLAQASFFGGRPESAIVEAERVIELSPNFSGGHSMRGLALARQGRFLEATRSIKQALRLNPRAPTGLLTIVAYVNYGAGRREEAIKLLERVRTANRDNVIVRVALAAFYEQRGRHGDAQAAAREALSVVPDLTTERAMQLIPGLETITTPEEFARYPEYLRKAGLKE